MAIFSFIQHLVSSGTRGIQKDRVHPPIKMYTLRTCSHCKATKKFMDKCAMKYEFTDVDLLDGEERAAILEDVKKINPICTFPTIIIGDKVIVGFHEDKIRESLGLRWTSNNSLKY